MPAGVDGAQFRELQIERQGTKPVQHLVVEAGVLFHLVQKCPVLVSVLGGMRAQVGAGLVRVRRSPSNGIELVVTHDRQRLAGTHHGAHDTHHLHLLRPPINVIAQEKCAAGRVAPHAGGLHIAQPIQQLLQRPCVAVDIPNNVVHDFPQK